MSQSDDLLTRLIPLVTADLQRAVSDLADQQVPPVMTAQIMLRLAATMIRDIEGTDVLRTTLDDTMNYLLPPPD